MFVNELLPILKAHAKTHAETMFLACQLAHANRDGQAWVSHARVSDETGISVRSSKRAAADLAKRGAIAIRTDCGVRTVYTFPCLDHPEHPLDMASPAHAPVVAKNATAAAPEPSPAPAPAPEHPTGDNPSPVAAPEPQPQTPAATPQHGELLPAETKTERAKRATRLPDDWQLPRAWGVWAMQEMGMTEDAVRWEADKFADYWHARSGQGATKMNWHATWRNWIRRNAESGGTASGAPQHKSKMTQALDNLANMKLDWEHQETWNPFAPMTPEERAAAQKREEARAAARIAEAAKIINFKKA